LPILCLPVRKLENQCCFTDFSDKIKPLLQEVFIMNQEKNTAVVTVLGRDRVGIIADVSRLLADYGININDISQTILDDIFTMVMMVDLKDLIIEESDISDKLTELGKKLGVQITIQHTGLFNAMHTI
jgi:ACT domain-containing protein